MSGDETACARVAPLRRRDFLAASVLAAFSPGLEAASAGPNILFAISDVQSFAHAGASGDPVVRTPAFDHVASEGVRFSHAF
ncbi:MAG: hypothetical protein OXH99_10955 [Bryobacterales bacterium]|nr:hypothetical protein [Bryobacterales bacterium]